MVKAGDFTNIVLNLNMVLDKTEKVISGIKRISKPGLRVYAGKDELPKVLGGLGTAIISTNKGIITDKEARKLQRRRRSYRFCLVKNGEKIVSKA
jgi:small subunit ribosomal protein S8